jgi:hypothetical protein
MKREYGTLVDDTDKAKTLEMERAPVPLQTTNSTKAHC